MYHEADWQRQGHYVYVTDSIMYVMWFTWDEKERGIQRWYWGTCPVAEAMTGFDVITTDGASFTDPTTRVPQKAGRARLYFKPDGEGLFQFNMPDTFGRGSVKLEVLAKGQNELSKGWFDPTRNGEGILLFVFGNRCHGALFTYRDHDRTPSYLRKAKIRKQRWLAFEGEFDGLSYLCNFHDFSGGRCLRFDVCDL
jgi:hypothetical protein